MALERNNYLDITKGIAMMLVFLGHAIQQSNSTLCYQNHLFIYIYTFHMPLFIVVSGYLFWNSFKRNENNLIRLLKRKSISLLLPLFSFSICMIPKTIIANIDHLDTSLIVNSFINYFTGNFLWFLWTVLFCIIFNSIIFKYCGKYGAICSFLFYILTMFVPDTIIYPMYKYLYLFFLIGMLFNKYDITKKTPKITFYIISCIITVVYLLILLPLYNFLFFNYDLNIISILKNGLWHIYIMRYLIAVCGCISMLFIIWIFKNYLSIFISIGKNSFGLYTIQCYLLSWLNNKLHIFESNIISTILIFFGLFLITSTLVYILKKNYILRMLFLGQIK